MEDLSRKSAQELSALLASGDISAVDVARDFIVQYERFNPTLNAIIEIDTDAALRQAQASDLRRRQGNPLGPLDGLPVTVKDNLFIKGFKASWGCKAYAEHRPEQDDICVARLRAAGANLFAKTNTPEFALAAHTDNLVYGATRNPWRTDLTPGGSSGGAVAALAAGIGALAVGTDAGGSIRRPASYAGVVGFRPSNGRIPRGAGFPPMAMDFQVIAPAARSVADCHLLFRTMAGPDAHDRSSRFFEGETLPHRLGEMPTRPLRILHVSSVDGQALDPDVRTQVDQAAEVLRGLGHRIDHGEMPVSLADVELAWGTLTATAVARLFDDSEDVATLASPASRGNAEKGRKLSATAYAKAIEAIGRIRQQLDLFFLGYDLLLSPASASLPWKVGEAFPPRIDGQPAGPRSAAVFATFVNAGGIPAISLPAGPGALGLPVGMQLAAPFGHDLRLLEVAHAFEAAAPWPSLAPRPFPSRTKERHAPEAEPSSS